MAQQGFDLNAILKQAQALQRSFEENKARLKKETATAPQPSTARKSLRK